MPFVSFLLPLMHIPAFAAPATSSKWIFLSAVIPLILACREFEITRAHKIGAVFIVWCAVTLFWAVSLPDGLMRLWQFCLMGGVFCLGSSLSMQQWRRCLTAFSLGVCINIILASVQLMGWDGVKVVTHDPAGLFVNANYLGEAAVAALGVGAYLPHIVVLLVIGVALSSSKGAVIGLTAVALIHLWRSHKIAAVWVGLICVTGASLYAANLGLNHPDIKPRLILFVNSLVSIDLWGFGVGSYWSAFPLFHDAVIESHVSVYNFAIRPRTAHNDMLTLGVEVGAIGLGLFLWFIREVLRRYEIAAFTVVVSVLALGLFSFPLFTPTTAFIGALAAGFLCRGGHHIRG